MWHRASPRNSADRWTARARGRRTGGSCLRRVHVARHPSTAPVEICRGVQWFGATASRGDRYGRALGCCCCCGCRNSHRSWCCSRCSPPQPLSPREECDAQAGNGGSRRALMDSRKNHVKTQRLAGQSCLSQALSSPANHATEPKSAEPNSGRPS